MDDKYKEFLLEIVRQDKEEFIVGYDILWNNIVKDAKECQIGRAHV